MRFLRSVGARLSLALLLVVAAALGIVYAVLVPILERSLVDSKLGQLEAAAAGLARRAPADPVFWQVFVENNAPSVNARVLILDIRDPSSVPLLVADSQQVRAAAQTFDDPLAVRASQAQAVQGGRIEVDERPFAVAAAPIPEQAAVVELRSPLGDTLANVELVRRRLLVAGGIALVFSLAIGYGAAYLFARRVRRLERAADRIASGRFDAPIHDGGGDEVAELAAAFDRMRLRLAGLERARREFIANASHELRTPIFSLGGFLELLDSEELDPETQREFIATARQQVERLTKLATDLLDLSRLDAGHVRLDRRPLDLADVAATLRDEFDAVARAGDHPIEAAAGGAAQGVGDEQRALQIGRILVENALVHTPPGTRVRVRAAQENGRAELVVEDDGPGIPPEQQRHVFERFYRVDGDRASGSGLGLAIAKELAELMGGTIEVDSRPGATRFRFTLPSAR